VSDASNTTEPRQKMPILKSKKELVALVVSSLIFAIVIYTMYFGKGDEVLPVAELADTATPVTVPVAGALAVAGPLAVPGPAPLSLQAILTSLNSETDANKINEPAKLTRSPFEMSAALRQVINGIKNTPPPEKTSSAPVVLTSQNARSVLAKIPGAERAAAAGLTLDAVMITSTWRGASINGEILPLGDTILGFTLTQVFEDRATLRLGKHQISLFVRPPNTLGETSGKNHTRTWRLPK